MRDLVRWVAACAVTCVGLAACTSSVTQPASPEPDMHASPTDSPTTDTAAFTRGWSVSAPQLPDAVVVDRQSGTVVVAADDELTAYTTDADQSIPRWSYRLPGHQEVGAIDAASGRIYVTLGEAARPDDFLVFNARNGTVTFQWSRAYALDADVPQLVGAYDTGAGIVKVGKDAISAALIMDKVTDQPQRWITDEDSAQVRVEGDLAATSLTSGEETTYIYFPSIADVTGAECHSVSDGVVCISSANGSWQAVEYDAGGYAVRSTEIPEDAAAFAYEVVGIGDDVGAREFAEALAQPVNQDASPDDPPTDEESRRPSPLRLSSSDLPRWQELTRQRAAAMYADGTWSPAHTWVMPQDDVELLPFHAPLALTDPGGDGAVLVDVTSGEQLTHTTTLVGSGTSADMFFEWEDGTLYVLEQRP